LEEPSASITSSRILGKKILKFLAYYTASHPRWLLFMVNNTRTSIPIQFDTPFLSSFLYMDQENGHSQ